MGPPVGTKAQSGDSIINLLQAVHKSVTDASCRDNDRPVISKRAMNVFLSDKTGYLSESTDLSFYTNYLTLNSVEGKLTVNHNFQKAKGPDEAIKALPCVGIWGRLTGGYAATPLNKSYETEMGISIGYKWLGKVKTKADGCDKPDRKKMAMDALRTATLYTLAAEIKKRSADFEASLSRLQATDLPGQNIDAAKAVMRRYFYSELQAEYEKNFAMQQASTLTETKNFTVVAMQYTGFAVSIPLLLPHYTQSISLTAPLVNRHPFDGSIQLNHTWLWESNKSGRLFLKAGCELFLNNTKWSYGLQQLTKEAYRNAGGRDTIHLRVFGNDPVFIGGYHSYLTPLVRGQAVYFPSASHIGLSVAAEQNIGRHHTFNTVLGIPVVLINKQKTPAATFTFSILFNDIYRSLPAHQQVNPTSFYISAGIPFSRLMF